MTNSIIKLVFFKNLLMSDIIKGRRRDTPQQFLVCNHQLSSDYYLNLIITNSFLQAHMSHMSIVYIRNCQDGRRLDRLSLKNLCAKMILIRLLVKAKGRQDIRVFQSVLMTIIRQTSGASAADVAGIRSSRAGGCQNRQK